MLRKPAWIALSAAGLVAIGISSTSPRGALTGHAVGGVEDGGCGGAPDDGAPDVQQVDDVEQALVLSSTPTLTTPATVTVARSSMLSGTLLTSLHGGVNAPLFTGRETMWDGATVGDTGFRDVDSDAGFASLFAALPVGSLRIPGGSDANFYDFDANRSWVDWVTNSTSQYNTPGIDWPGLWSFHAAVGSPPLMTTANVYSSGNPTWAGGHPTWISASQAGRWAQKYKMRGITGAYWEAGNETYIADAVPGMSYPGDATSSTSYVVRACAVSRAIKAVDASAKVGLVVYEWGVDSGSTSTLLANTEAACGLSSFDFFVVHDYAPLVPSKARTTGATPTFTHAGVQKALAFQQLTSSVRDLRAFLQASYPSSASKPIHVTEYGLLFDLNVFDGVMWNSGWTDKGVALLLMRHWLDLVAQGADGAWFWDMYTKWFRLADPDGDPAAGAETGAYTLLQELLALNGRLIEADVSSSRTFRVDGPVGSGCIEGWPTNADGTIPTAADESCWHTALGFGTTSRDLSYVQAYAALPSIVGRQLQIVVMNFGEASQPITLKLDGFSLPSSVSLSTWQIAAADWDGALGSPTTSSKTVSVSTRSDGTQTLSAGTLAARTAWVLSVPVSSIVLLPAVKPTP